MIYSTASEQYDAKRFFLCAPWNGRVYVAGGCNAVYVEDPLES